MKHIQPQAMCPEMSGNNADRLEFVRDSLQDLQANVAWIQGEAGDELKSLALRGLVMCQYRSNSDPPCQSKTDPPPLNHSSVVAFVFFWS